MKKTVTPDGTHYRIIRWPLALMPLLLVFIFNREGFFRPEFWSALDYQLTVYMFLGFGLAIMGVSTAIMTSLYWGRREVRFFPRSVWLPLPITLRREDVLSAQADNYLGKPMLLIKTKTGKKYRLLISTSSVETEELALELT